MEETMRIAVIGGRLKSDETLSRIARQAGYELELHQGDLHGRGVDEIRAAVGRSDLVVILTEVNSHGAVLVAKKAARQLQRPSLVIRRLSGARLRTLLDALDARRLHEADHAAVALAATG